MTHWHIPVRTQLHFILYVCKGFIRRRHRRCIPTLKQCCVRAGRGFRFLASSRRHRRCISTLKQRCVRTGRGFRFKTIGLKGFKQAPLNMKAFFVPWICRYHCLVNIRRTLEKQKSSKSRKRYEDIYSKTFKTEELLFIHLFCYVHNALLILGYFVILETYLNGNTTDYVEVKRFIISKQMFLVISLHWLAVFEYLFKKDCRSYAIREFLYDGFIQSLS